MLRLVADALKSYESWKKVSIREISKPISLYYTKRKSP
jgi:hypothetical protein